MSGSGHGSYGAYYQGPHVNRTNYVEPRQSTRSQNSQARYHHVDRSPYYVSPTVDDESSHRQQISSSAYYTTPSSSHRTFLTSDPMQRWERETMREQPYNGVQSVRSDARIYHSQINGGSHGSYVGGSTSAQKGSK